MPQMPQMPQLPHEPQGGEQVPPDHWHTLLQVWVSVPPQVLHEIVCVAPGAHTP
jgi:hypothetical protein